MKPGLKPLLITALLISIVFLSSATLAQGIWVPENRARQIAADLIRLDYVDSLNQLLTLRVDLLMLEIRAWERLDNKQTQLLGVRNGQIDILQKEQALDRRTIYILTQDVKKYKRQRNLVSGAVIAGVVGKIVYTVLKR